MRSRFIVGIDLGTTNCAVAYVDTRGSHGLKTPIATFQVPQLVGQSDVRPRPMLPSFLYVPGAHDLPAGSITLPWDPARAFAVGEFAREQGSRVPGRLISSAKSWLCHAGVDRRAALLPWAAQSDVRRLSPVQVSAEYLRHIREAWNANMSRGDESATLESQDIVLTVPASFDEVARDLTVEAATLAGLTRLTLIEEPQAAFYAWSDRIAGSAVQPVSVGQIVLVCDVGGGTTDFTLIRVDESDGKLSYRRVAVGDHLMLGGDNIDVALARQTELRLMGQTGKLDSVQWSGLVQSCRAAKEALLGERAPDRVPVAVAGRTSRVIGGRLQLELTRGEVLSLVLDGFLPAVSSDSEPARRAASGLQEFGLPYVADPAITRHLAMFLRRHRVGPTDQDAAALTRPDAVLFNGGALTPAVVRERIVDVLTSWFRSSAPPDWKLTVLDSESLDLAVARGAAQYGVVRRGGGVRIGGGTARTYYVGIESPAGGPQLSLCVVPRGMEEGDEIKLGGREFELLVGKPVGFPIYTSTMRMQDQAGDVVPVDDQSMDAMPPVQTTLRAATRSSAVRMVPVSLLSRYTELGTVELWCVARQDKRRWRLQFQTRSPSRVDSGAALPESEDGEASARSTNDSVTIDQSLIDRARELIVSAFAPRDAVSEAIGHEDLMRSLRELFGLGRDLWPTALLRDLWETIFGAAAGRRLSSGHERRWINLAGFCLRPGCGYPHDDYRVAQWWRIANTGTQFPRDEPCRVQWWIMARRVAAGLTAAQQELLYGRIATALLPSGAKSRKASGARPGTEERVEMWRLAANLSRITDNSKALLGQALLRDLRRPPYPPHVLWAIARIGARIPLYGPVHTVVNHSIVTEWIGQILDNVKPKPDRQEVPAYCFALSSLARRTGDRHRDISDELRSRVIQRLGELEASPHMIQSVVEVTALDDSDQRLAFGESLPAGLRMMEESF